MVDIVGAKEKICTFCLWSETSKSPWIFTVTFETTSIMNDSYLNSDIVCDGLERLRKRYPDQYLYIILDNAACQHCRKVRDKAEK